MKRAQRGMEEHREGLGGCRGRHRMVWRGTEGHRGDAEGVKGCIGAQRGMEGCIVGMEGCGGRYRGVQRSLEGHGGVHVHGYHWLPLATIELVGDNREWRSTEGCGGAHRGGIESCIGGIEGCRGAQKGHRGVCRGHGGVQRSTEGAWRGTGAWRVQGH